MSSLLECLRSRIEGRAQYGLVKVHTAIAGRCDEGDTKTTAPVTEQVRKAGSFVVFLRPQLRIGDEVHGHKEQPVAEALQCASPRIMAAIDFKRHVAVDKHCESNDTKAQNHKDLRGDQPSLQELRRYWRENGDHQSSRSEHKACVNCSITI